MTGADTVHATAWALKQACYDAWHTAPAKAREAADRLAALAVGADDPLLHTLAAWTAGIAELSDGHLTEALQALQAAAAGFGARGDAQHAAEARVPQVVALAMLGRDAEAQACAEVALAQFVATGDQRSAGKIELNLGTMLSRQDRHAEAAERFRHAGVRFARVGDAELSVMADGALANTLTWQFRFDDAARMFERSRVRAAARGYAVLRAQAHQGLGRIALNRGEWHRALQELAQASRLLVEVGAPPQRRIEAEAALADAYLAVNLLDEAVALYERTAAEANTLQAPTERAWALLQRARALGRLGRHEEALAGFEAARALYAAADNRPTLGFIDLARGQLELATGAFAAALGSAGRAAEVLAGSGIVGWQLEARVLEAGARAAGGDGDGGGVNGEGANGGGVAAASALFANVLTQAGGLPQVAQACHTGLGRLALEAGALAAARRHFEQALDIVDGVRALLPADEFRSALGATADAAHAGLVAVALAQGDAQALLADLERGRARALAQALAPVPLPAGDDTSAGAVPAPGAAAAAPAGAAPGAAATRLQWLRDAWRQAVSDDDRERLPALTGQLQALEHELLETARRERLRPALAATPLAALDIAALQATLGPARALLVYHLQGEEIVACAVTSDGLACQCWPAGELQALLQRLRFQLDTLRHGAPALQRHGPQLQARVQACLQALHQRLWQPVLPLLQGRSEVVVVPHRELHYLPFAALHDGRQSLVQQHRLSLTPSATVWMQLQSRPAPRFHRALVLGVGGAGLPQVAAEVQAVAAAFEGRAEVRLEQAATQAALATGAASADVLHLACHARFRADNPAFSFLQLGDGPMTLDEVRALHLPARLVTLSACETGRSRIAPGDEVLGLVRAFTLAGADAVLATLWPVDDAACAALVTRFYAGLQGGAGPAQALQQAQAEAAKAGQHPFLWAAFTLHGRG
ncbi:MAG: CHAT domain-containing protein [Rubrivivax sp.]|nr:CHAT domain-containing protein [Rubrivivax sp.]